jgi:four helix bundle protein
MIEDERLKSISDQLIRAVGSISANIAEGYSRGSGKDQARFYEYALGSARESRGWYYQGRRLLGEKVVNHRLKLIEGIIRQLMTIIPSQRGHKIKEERANYTSNMEALLSTIPLPVI